MNILVVGASGATGKLLVDQLLASGHKVKIIVRSTNNLPSNWKNNSRLTMINSSITDISIDEMSNIIYDCQGVASCLGHNLTWKGVYGKPRRLVADTVKLVCDSIIKNASSRPIKFVLMNTAGNINRDLNETISFKQKIVVGIIRLLLPPHADNEVAADYLRKQIGQSNENIDWVVVRPDNLLNEEKISDYTVHKSPIRSAIFNPGKTSRINVGDFMAKLFTNENLWQEWKGQMPVIYNKHNY